MTETLCRHIAELDAVLTMGERKKNRVPKYLIGALANTLEEMNHHTDSGYRDLMLKMKEAYETDILLPVGLQANLRPYQEDGYRWMKRLDAWGAGACLADDMGLGKTLQALAFMLSKASEGPSLVVAPKSVIPNWVAETQKFAPQMGVVVLNDSHQRELTVDCAKDYTLVLCTYGVLNTESDLLAAKEWNVVCLDEAQQIKNRTTLVSQAAMNLNAKSRIILTGTPLQNHVGELWNLMQFINPGLLGRWNVFRDTYVNATLDETHKEMLKEMTQPFILRRTKEEVLDDLPEKVEGVHYVSLSENELGVYEAMRKQVELKFKKGKTKEERAAARDLDISYFDELMKLRLISCDMHLVYDRWKEQSTKITALMEILETLMDVPENNILVFSQFTSFLARIKPELEKRRWDYLYLDGQTPMKKRQTFVEQFQQGEKRLFLSSLKAGGLGINLTAANYVILLDPWWNPAIENQATDRAHRIGQKRCVSIIRLISEHTIEEKILRLHEKKQQLSDEVLSGTSDSYKLTYEDILDMVAPY
jgi:SNF2 family DNA or RNA helicase